MQCTVWGTPCEQNAADDEPISLAQSSTPHSAIAIFTCYTSVHLPLCNKSNSKSFYAHRSPRRRRRRCYSILTMDSGIFALRCALFTGPNGGHYTQPGSVLLVLSLRCGDAATAVVQHHLCGNTRLHKHSRRASAPVSGNSRIQLLLT